MRGKSGVDHGVIIHARQFDIHQGAGKSDMADPCGDASAIGILSSDFDVMRPHERHAVGVIRRTYRSGTIAIGLACVEEIITAQELKDERIGRIVINRLR